MGGNPPLRASVVIPSYNRGPALAELLEQFVGQTAGKSAFEVIVVDDGSKVDPRPGLPSFDGKLALHVERQANRGAACARQRGAELAGGDLLIFLDDDMRIERTFVERHLAAHEGRPRAAVLGRLRALPSIATMPLFERYYARMLDRVATQADGVATRETGLPGPKLYTGNMSIPKALFFEAGGFDADFRLLEDVELGIRLERVGGRIFFSSEAGAVHGSDHVSTERWLDRSLRDGVYATKVAHKHRLRGGEPVLARVADQPPFTPGPRGQCGRPTGRRGARAGRDGGRAGRGSPRPDASRGRGDDARVRHPVLSRRARGDGRLRQPDAGVPRVPEGGGLGDGR
jgi:GT2 family glycosyltransferase